MGNKQKLHVAISLDVEEEGLFSGHYAAKNPGVENIALLPKLAPLASEFNLPLTLFCSHAVLANKSCRKTLAFMRDQYGAEIAAHLHHWSTPPYSRDLDENSPPCRTHILPRNILVKRLQNLLAAGRDFQGEPLRSFRMGRWDLKSRLLPLLAENGIQTDSSICPLRAFANGPDHFLAPADPYWLNFENGTRILEAPITQLPVSPLMAKIWFKLARKRPKLLDSFHFFGALSANPFWHGQQAMRMATRLHAARGGQVLSFFWHSSEMMPGASPHTPNQAAADRVLKKIFSFCAWLKDNYAVEGVRVCDLAKLTSIKPFPDLQHKVSSDWQ